MKPAILLATLSAAAHAGRHSTFESLSQADQVDVHERLAKWKALYGPIAEANGFTLSRESLNVNSHSTQELERFHHTIRQVEEASKLNPLATFSEFNQFALLTDAEFKQMLQSSYGDHNATNIEPTVVESSAVLETEVDWSTSKCMPPVTNQGSCASCWAFASIGAVEAAHCLATGELLDLSEQQLVDCEPISKGCRGGYPPIAINWMQDGLCLESAVPYNSGVSGKAGTCSTTCEKKKLTIGKLGRAKGEEALQRVLNTQPVAVLVEAGNLVWKNYKSGVVTQCPGMGSDHAVLAVGYGTSTDDFFKIKNSWGPQWGDNGYMYLKRGVGEKGMCSVAESVSYPLLGGSSPQPAPSSNTPTTTRATPVPSTTTTKPKTTQPSLTPTDAPATTTTTSPASTTPKPTRKTHKPRKTTRQPTTTPLPSTSLTPQTTSTPSSSPTTNAPKACGSCKGCYFADVKWCVNVNFGHSDCTAVAGATWCGPSSEATVASHADSAAAPTASARGGDSVGYIVGSVGVLAVAAMVFAAYRKRSVGGVPLEDSLVTPAVPDQTTAQEGAAPTHHRPTTPVLKAGKVEITVARCNLFNATYTSEIFKPDQTNECTDEQNELP